MIQIIAYGNPLREDDGAGLLLASKLETALRRLAVEVQRGETHQLTPELAAELADGPARAVVFVDTRLAGSDADKVAVQPIQPGDGTSPSLGHHLDPAAVLAYASALSGQAPLPAWLATAPGWQFGYGEQVSALSQRAVSTALDDPTSPLAGLVSHLHRLATTWRGDAPTH